MQRKLKLIFDGGDFDSMKCKLGYGGAYGGVWSQAVGFVLVLLAGIWFQSSWRCFHITSKEIL
jgi:hypothetical protein